jgi:hypothetical protein
MCTFEIIDASPLGHSTTLIASADKCGQAGYGGWCIIVIHVCGVHSRLFGWEIIVGEALVSKRLVHWIYFIFDIGIVEVVFLVPEKFIVL